MTSELLDEAIDPTIRDTPHVHAWAGTLVEPLPPVRPTPEDPDEEYVPGPPPRDGIRVHACLYRAVSLDHIGVIRTAEVEDWCEDVSLVEPTDAGIECSSTDPIWQAAGKFSHRGPDGREKFTWDPKGYVVVIFVDGRADAAFVFAEPLDIGGGRVRLPAQGPAPALWSSQFLGHIEQPDLLDGWGDFEGVPLGTEPPGLVKIPDPGETITATVVLDGVRGTRCLQVSGRGVVRTPPVIIQGHAQARTTASFSAFGRYAANLDGEWATRTRCQRVDSLAPTDREYTIANQGVIRDAGNGFSADPTTSACRLSQGAIAHRVWGEMRSFSTPTRYDVGTIRQDNLSGFLNPTDLSLVLERAIRELGRPSIGGYVSGLTAQVDGLTGSKVRWVKRHSDHLQALDVVTEILARTDGPEAWMDPDFRIHIVPRIGRWRPEFALTAHTLITPQWAEDPAAQVDDWFTDTGRGSGPTLVPATVRQPMRPNRFRVARLARPPREMGVNAARDWTNYVAEGAARRQITAEVDVAWRHGEMVRRGDTFWFVAHDGDRGEQLVVRLLRRRKIPRLGIHRLTIGLEE